MSPLSNEGYAAIGIYDPKHEVNVGTLIRSAACFGANLVFTVGGRRRVTADCGQHLTTPLLRFQSVEEWRRAMPKGATVVSVEITDDAEDLRRFQHPRCAVYLLGNESYGIPPGVMENSVVVKVPTRFCLNVSVTGGIILYDRALKMARDSKHGAK